MSDEQENSDINNSISSMLCGEMAELMPTHEHLKDFCEDSSIPT
jgi:hypothetical protein